MPLRNGKEYLISHKCSQCKKFYSNEKFEYQCSECFGFLESDNYLNAEEFKNLCDKWAADNTIRDDNIIRLLKRAARVGQDELLLSILKLVKEETNKFITAKFALKLYKNFPSLRRGHVVASYVADWWNINSIIEKEWPQHLVCYYGNYNEPLERRQNVVIPPRYPNKIIN